MVFSAQVELGTLATSVEWCSDSSTYGYALHATPTTSEELGEMAI